VNFDLWCTLLVGVWVGVEEFLWLCEGAAGGGVCKWTLSVSSSNTSLNFSLFQKNRTSIAVIPPAVSQHDTTLLSSSSSLPSVNLSPSIGLRFGDSIRLITFSKDFQQSKGRMGLTLSSVLSRLFGKKQMRILMGKLFYNSLDLELTYSTNYTIDSIINPIKLIHTRYANRTQSRLIPSLTKSTLLADQIDAYLCWSKA